MIIWQATQAPSRSMYLEGKGESFIQEYVEIGRMLKNCGCTNLCMCCNTAHYFIDTIQEQINVPFVNLIIEVANETKRIKAKRIGLMCTEGLAKVRLYNDVFKKEYPEAEIIYPDDEFQELVTLGICNAKNIHRYCNDEYNPQHLFPKVISHLIEKGSDCVVAGCTDIRTVFHQQSTEKIKYIDSLEILASTLVNLHKNGQIL